MLVVGNGGVKKNEKRYCIDIAVTHGCTVCKGVLCQFLCQNES